MNPINPAVNMQLQFEPSQSPLANEFYQKTMPIYAAIQEINPSYKQTVGQVIFDNVTKLTGAATAPKITGMLIDLPCTEIQNYCRSYDLFASRVTQAQQMLAQQQS